VALSDETCVLHLCQHLGLLLYAFGLLSIKYCFGLWGKGVNPRCAVQNFFLLKLVILLVQVNPRKGNVIKIPAGNVDCSIICAMNRRKLDWRLTFPRLKSSE
jgi:hypothetical protein